MCHSVSSIRHIPDDRIFDGVNIVLSYQNDDGGWATYENTRGWNWYEYLNPAEVFGDIMIDYSYVELSSACVTGLAKFRKLVRCNRVPLWCLAPCCAARMCFVRVSGRPSYACGGRCVCGVHCGVPQQYPNHRRAEVDRAISRGARFISNVQRADGSWYGSWAICFTYGTWFGVEGLIASGTPPSHPRIQKCV